jgi:hypothetical protein
LKSCTMIITEPNDFVAQIDDPHDPTLIDQLAQ